MGLGGSQAVLVIEDDRAIADTVVYALKTEGFIPEWVATGAAGLERIAQGGIDLVLLDVGLPDAHGFDVLREINRLARIPVIIVTARDETIDRVTGLELGADDYITKPFSPREVTARVRAVLNLLQNALEFSPSGSEVKLSLHRENGRAILRVEDAGVGIPDFARDRIFDRFYSLPRPVSGRKSTGLGLSLVREIMELHKGSAAVMNRSEGGVCAELRWEEDEGRR